MTKKQTGTAAALIGFAFLLGTAVIGCEKDTTTTVPVPVAGAPGAPGAPAADAAPQEKTSESSTTTKTDNGMNGSSSTTDKTTTQKTN